MKIAILGSREIGVKVAAQVRNYVSGLPKDTEVITGSAYGVDKAVLDEAREAGYKYQEFVPDYITYGAAAPLFRVDTVLEHAEKLVVFWDGICKETNYAIGRARIRNMPIELIKIPVFQGEDSALQADDLGSSPSAGTTLEE